MAMTEEMRDALGDLYYEICDLPHMSDPASCRACKVGKMALDLRIADRKQIRTEAESKVTG